MAVPQTSIDQRLFRLLGRKHALPVLQWLLGRTAAASLTEIDYAVVRSHPSARAIMRALEDAGLVTRFEDKRYSLSEAGRVTLARVSGAVIRPSGS